MAHTTTTAFSSGNKQHVNYLTVRKASLDTTPVTLRPNATRNGILPSKAEVERQISKKPNNETIETVQKWGLKYDGGINPLGFIEQVEKLASLNEIKLNNIMRAMPALLKDKALVWYRNYNKRSNKWSTFKHEFCKYFLQSQYFEKLSTEICKRKQGQQESFRHYVLAIQDLMRHADFLSPEQKLDRIFQNSHPDYQWYIRRTEFTTLDEFISLATKIETTRSAFSQDQEEHHHFIHKQRHHKKWHPVTTPVPAILKCGTSLTWEADKIQATIRCEQKTVTATIDTGATRSFMLYSLMRKLFKLPEPKTVHIEVLLFDRSNIIVTQSIVCSISMGNVRKPHTFLLLETGIEPLILGIDFLQEFGATLTCAGLSAAAVQ